MNSIFTWFYLLFVMFTPDVSACKLGWIRENGSCYYFSKDYTNFFSATGFCNFYGGRLVEIDSWEEYITLKRLTTHTGIQNFWIGLTDMFVEGVWVKAKSLESQTFTMWRSGEPDNHMNVENCAQWITTYNTWGDRPCHDSIYFVCEQ